MNVVSNNSIRIHRVHCILLWVLSMRVVVVPEIIESLKGVEKARGNGAVSDVVSLAVAHKS